MSSKMNLYISGAKRTPIGKYRGIFNQTPATQLGSYTISAAIKQSQCDPASIEQVVMGCVLPAGLGQAPARQAALGASLSNATPCVTVNKMCGSGLQAIIQSCDTLLSGRYNTVIAGGLENMTRAPECTRADGEHFSHMMHDGLEDAYHPGKAMGYFAERCAEQYHFSRAQQDDYAKTSLLRAQSADFKDEIIPITIDDTTYSSDEGPQRLKPEKIATLKPIFKENGTVTAANASSISDGAAAVVLSNHESHAIARIVGYATHAQAPEWFTTAPVGAIEKLLQQCQWTVDDVDLFEINEAFAVVPLYAMQQLKIPHDKVNINGGACVLGHPIGATGTRIVVTLINALRQRQLTRGIASLCIGGGEAQAIAIECL